MPEQPTTGRGLKFAGIGLIALGGVLYAVLGGPVDDAAALLGVSVMIAGMLAHFRGRQQAAKARPAGRGEPARGFEARCPLPAIVSHGRLHELQGPAVRAYNR